MFSAAQPFPEKLSDWVTTGLVATAILFNLVFLWHEVSLPVPNLNDNVLHYTLVERADLAWSSGENLLDHWVSYWTMGYPIFGYYQHLPHIAVVALYRLFAKIIPLFTLFNLVKYLLLSLFPLAIYIALCKFEFDKATAALSALSASLLSTNGLYGFDSFSYVWLGHGVYTQLWGMVLLPLALAQIYSTLKYGRGYFASVLLLVATLLSHVIYGYMAVLSALLFIFIRSESTRVRQKATRLLLILTLSGVVASYFLIPYFLNRDYVNRSIWEMPEKYDSYGHEYVLINLFNGNLLDFGRFPVLTLLALIGLAWSISRWREERNQIAWAFFAFWLLLYFGRPTWGILLRLLPLSTDIHFHRFISGLHLATIILIGIGLSFLCQVIRGQTGDVRSKTRGKKRATRIEQSRWSNKPLVFTPLALLLTFSILLPVWLERINWLGQNQQWMKRTKEAFDHQERNLKELSDTLRGLKQKAEGRIYAGQGNNWGRNFVIGSVPMYAFLSVHQMDALSYLYHALSLNSDIQVHFNETDPTHYNLFNIRYIVAPQGKPFPPFAKPFKVIGNWVTYVVETSGYFDLVDSDIAFSAKREGLYNANFRWLNSGLLPAKQHPTIFFLSESQTSGTKDQKEGHPTPELSHYQQWLDIQKDDFLLPGASNFIPRDRGKIKNERVENQNYSVEVLIKEPCFLLLKMTYHPYWRAYVDGAEKKAVMLSPSFIGVRMEPGVHHIDLRYEPPLYKSSLLIVGIMALLGVFFLERKFESRPIPQELSSLTGAEPSRNLSEILGRLRLTKVVEKLRLNLPSLAAIGFLAFIAGLPLFQGRHLSGHDALAYLPRIIEFYKGLTEGSLLPRWAEDFASGYGEPFFNFNGPLFYYLASLIHVPGFSFLDSMNLSCFVLLLGSGLTMYLLASEFFGPAGGLVAAAAYIYAPYTLTDLYVRGAYAEFSAFPFPPLLFWAFYKLAESSSVLERCIQYLIIASIAYALLLLCNNTTSLIVTFFLGLFVLISSLVSGSWRAALLQVSGILLGLMLTAFFWLPALVEKDFVQVDNLLKGYLNYRNHFVYFHQLIYSPWGFGLSGSGPKDGMSYQIGPVHLLMSIVSVFLLIRNLKKPSPTKPSTRKKTKPIAPAISNQPHVLPRSWLMMTAYFFIAILLTIFFTTSASLLIWDRISLLQYLQFPWRFLIMMAVSTSFLCAVPFQKPGNSSSRSPALLIICLALILVFNYVHAKPEKFHAVKESYFSPENIVRKRIEVVTAREYRPRWSLREPPMPAFSRLSLIKGDAKWSESKTSSSSYLFQVDALDDSILRFNIHYFPGWKVLVDDKEAITDYSNEYGLMDFHVPKGRHTLQAKFTHTGIRSLAQMISGLGSIFILVLLLYTRFPGFQFWLKT